MTLEERRTELMTLAGKQSEELQRTVGAINEIDRLIKEEGKATVAKPVKK